MRVHRVQSCSSHELCEGRRLSIGSSLSKVPHLCSIYPCPVASSLPQQNICQNGHRSALAGECKCRIWVHDHVRPSFGHSGWTNSKSKELLSFWCLSATEGVLWHEECQDIDVTQISMLVSRFSGKRRVGFPDIRQITALLIWQFCEWFVLKIHSVLPPEM